ncbi:hypothetical protein AN8478.2 [Aspergillus nidulans FGSC A4]|uniref:Uncharacterized protein n=1 Tax=Emericella nidulans (strain FGSC A4 / ATCC 38163 / CBS 112.46 / NRRL 194 / M139) TaxID=227321 RepID=Q5ATA2_EMENI|nr:hypothetical protein [Aspergillus nidulans FGSC A4]EAA67100.1 hypothetical protein AN8478.2 [Aspergillus nidulans FGSC A4]CBF80632.1 TPA: conserved hypothetical protein [Aspergillus nidulans FGSC A4]|eukprot:XP_681747.1 hypothetical protein AN8478.2 [Aspergillus nidulans FGSC A4]
MSIHVVSKTNNHQHATIDLPPSDSSPLKQSSVRIRPSLLSLTSNNLTYALLGNFLRWWDAYPVPQSAPAPYNNTTEWGIVPAWGLATVLESTLPGIPLGTVLFGFWPTGSHAVDLELKPSELDGHWKEVSEHRAHLMPLYNRYRVFDTQGKDVTEFAWDAAVGTVFAAGYLMSEYIFTSDPAVRPPIHPCGIVTDQGVQDWTAADADLSRAVLVSLGASTKTARSMAYNLFQRPSGTGPLGLLQFTSSPGPIGEAARALNDANGKSKFAVGNLGYPDVGLAAKWLADIEPLPRKVIIADFGSRDGILESVVEDIKKMESLQGVDIVIIAVGNQQKVYTLGEIQARQASFASLNKVQMNTSDVYEAAIKLRGAADYFREVDQAWQSWLENREAAAPDLNLVWGEGIAGQEGIEAGWDRLCASSVAPGEALVYRI